MFNLSQFQQHSYNDPNILKDFVIYEDTDSIFVMAERFFTQFISQDQWNSLDWGTQLSYVWKLGEIVEDYINDKIYHDVQLTGYNSNNYDFRTKFKQEKIARTGIFPTKKRYATWTIYDEKKYKNDLSVTGMELITSSTPEVIKVKLKEALNLILKLDEIDYENIWKREKEDEILTRINEMKDELKNIYPEEIAANLSANKLGVYLDKDNRPLKGAGWHVKGVGAYNTLLDNFTYKDENGEEHLLGDKYEKIMNGEKVKVVYVKRNSFGFNSLAFHRWPKELNEVLQVDYNKMIEKFFTNKLKDLLKLINKDHILTQSQGDLAIKMLFE